MVVGALVALFAMGAELDHTHRTFDLTVHKSLTLTQQTRDVVRGVRHKVEVTALVGRQESGRPEAAALLQRYHRLNRRVTFRVVDPSDAPTAVQRLKMDPTVDLVAAASGTKVARAPTITEQDITKVISQVVRNVSATLCVTTGHGERDLAAEDDTGLAAAGRLLDQNGYQIKQIDLLTAPAVPADCTGVVVAAPTAPFGPAVTAITSYLAATGRMILLADPESGIDPSPLLVPYEITVQRGIVIDPGADAHLPDDAATTIVRSYHSTNPTVRGLAPTLFPAAEAVVLGDITGIGGLAVDPVISAGDSSYLETHPEHAGFTAGEDKRGPIVIGATADLSRVVNPSRIDRSRVVVFGDVDFASNKFIAVGGNARLLVQAIDWATLNEDLVPLNANIPAFRPLELTAGRTRYARLLSTGIIPALFLLAGGWVWALRRSR
jgi:hypothetical protein